MSRVSRTICVAVAQSRPPSGHVFRVERARGPVWYAKCRLPDGRQVQKKLGPAWTGRGRPAAGYFTKRLAEDWLRGVLDEARRGVLPGMVRTGATFADAAAEWLRYIEEDRLRKPSTVATYRTLLRSRILPAFAEEPLESVTPTMIERWLSSMDGSPATLTKALAMVHERRSVDRADPRADRIVRRAPSTQPGLGTPAHQIQRSAAPMGNNHRHPP